LAWLQAPRLAPIVALVLPAALSLGRVTAQPDALAGDDQSSAAEQAIEEITVIGRRFLRDLRIEVQASRERVYGLFNSLNSNDEFDIDCHTAARTGTRMSRRVCRPRFVDDATHAAGKWYLIALHGGPGGGLLAAQAEMGVVPLKERQLAAELQRLTRESREFRRAIAEYQAVERRYAEVRSAAVIEASASIVDTYSSPSLERLNRRDSKLGPRPGEFATTAVHPSREGWVKMRYSVLADGRTANVRVVDALPSRLDPTDAIRAVETWMFEPASDGREPIAWHNNLAVISFSRPDAEFSGSLEFADAYEQVAELIAGGQLEDARSRNEAMQRVYAETLEEIQLAQLQLAAIEHALGRRHAALVAIRRATEQGVAGLAEEELKLALEHRFALELALGYAADALRTYDRRTDLERLSSRDPLAQQAAALKRALEAPDATQAVQAQISATGDWEHMLPSGVFELSGVVGDAETLALECDRNKAELAFQPNVQMTIPASWGGCVLTVRGQPDTTFTLYEFL
jgi:hypothetical protein